MLSILHEIPWDTYLSTSIITHTEGMWEYLGGVAMQANPFGPAGEGRIASDRNEDMKQEAKQVWTFII